MAVEEIIALRPSRRDDEEFLFGVYAQTRIAELSVTGWGPEQTDAFLRMQFRAQDVHYRREFAAARFDIITLGARDVGRFYVLREERALHLLDIALLPKHRGQGIGSRLLSDLLREAGQTGRVIQLHVEAHNPARLWYERLGFRSIADSGVYLEMRWVPPESAVPREIDRGTVPVG